MFRSKQLRSEAAQLRDRIDRGGWLVRQHAYSLMQQVRALARSPAALPVAFVSGILAERLLPGIKRAFYLLAGQAKAMQIASSAFGSPIR